jgi:2-C-methyl-D-erythritol 2,4-cyclodiphosphate synthase
MQFRIGYGYDAHKLETGRKLVLGTVNVPNDKGSLAHSDGDVLLHAICDALLGAAGLRDIGFHFPDSDPSYKDIESSALLANVNNSIRSAGYHISNIDCTVVLQSPKISEYIPQMKDQIAAILNLLPSQISVKATTTENLGFEGRKEGISAHAVVLIYTN